MPECPEPSTMAAFIAGTLGDAERERVAAHVDRCPICLEVVASAGEDTAGAPEDAASVPLGRGDTVGRYLLVDKIGTGGFGEVFSAYDPKLDRKLAIKVVRRAMFATPVDPEAEARALREAQALARLAHPNVVAVHDAGTTEGRLFIAMEYIEGETLSAWQQRETPTWQAARDVYLDAGRGLAAAHAAGFVHRDFKPSNVMIGPEGRVRVLDFGLVRPAAAAPSLSPEGFPAGDDSDLQTRTGTLLGTPAYMAPEQRRHADVDARADQYALCLSMWESVFGSRPARTSNGLDLRVPPNAGSVPSWLVRALTRGLSERPEDRFASIDELLRALEQDKRRRTHWVWGAVAGALVSGVAAVSIVSLSQEPTAAVSVDVVDRASRAARDAAARAYFVYPPPDDATAHTAYLGVLELEAFADDEGRGQAEAERLREEFAETLVRLGDTYFDAPGGMPFALDYYASALVFSPAHPHALARAAVTPGELRSLRARARDKAFGPAELSASRVLVALALPDPEQRDQEIAALLDAEPPIALQTQTRLRQLRPKLRPKTPKVVAKVDGPEPEPPEEPPEDEPVVIDDLPDVPSPGERRDPTTAAKLVKQADAARKAGKFAKAETLYHRALAKSPRNGSASAGLARLHRELGQYAKALPYAKAAVKARPKNAGLQLLLGDLHAKALDYGKARAAYQRARDLGSSAATARLDRLSQKTGG